MGAEASVPRDSPHAAALAALEQEQLAAALAASLATPPGLGGARLEAAAHGAGGARAPPATQHPTGVSSNGTAGGMRAHAPQAPPFPAACVSDVRWRDAGRHAASSSREEEEALVLALALSASEAEERAAGAGEAAAAAAPPSSAPTPPSDTARRSDAAAAQLAADAALAAALAEAELASASAPRTPAGAYGRAGAADDAAADDAQLAAALQAEEQAQVAPPPTAAPMPFRAGVCAGCEAPLSSLSSLFTGSTTLHALGRTWHAGCFRCALCGERIVERTFAVLERDGGPRPAHATCQREAYHPRCAVCHDFIPARGGAVTFKLTPVWDERWCPEHEADGTRRCCGCDRLEPRPQPTQPRRDEAHASLPDGRALCVGCVPSAVVDENDAAPLYHEVLTFFAGLGAPLPAVPPLRLVDAGVLAALAARDDAPHGAPTAEDDALSSGRSILRGVTLTEEVVVRQVARDPMSELGAALSWGLLGAEALPRRCDCRVTCIAVLSALPRLLAGAVLAHECCHALLRLGNAPRSLSPRVEEGVCQLMGLLWLEQQAATLSEPHAVAHAAQLAHAIRNDVSDVYGGGARDAIRAYRAVGLARLLDSVRATGRLPPLPDGAGDDDVCALTGTH